MRNKLFLWVLLPWVFSVPLLAIDIYMWGMGAAEMGPIGLFSQEPGALALLGILVTIVVPPTLVLLLSKLLRNVSHLLGFERLERTKAIKYAAISVCAFVLIPLVHDYMVLVSG